MELDLMKIRTAVKESGIKQKAIAEKCGIGEKSMSYVLLGRQSMKAVTFLRICDVLGMDPMGFTKKIE